MKTLFIYLSQIWSMNNDLSENETEKNFKCWGTSDSEHSTSMSDKIIEMEDFECINPSLIELSKIPESFNFKEEETKCKRSSQPKILMQTNVLNEYDISHDRFDESLVGDISRSMY